MKRFVIILPLLLAFVVSCGKTETTDPTPTPTPVDQSKCRYVLSYSLRYSELSKTKPTTLVYLDSLQKPRTITLQDTSVTIRTTYKYGDSVYVRFASPNVYFAGKTGNRLIYAYQLQGSSSNQAGCPGIGKNSSNTVTGIARDSVPSSVYAVAPFRIST
ncbi:hypothetical protein GCM10027578_30450 [Spirosoma luteolum]